MRQKLDAENWVDDDGNPAGGVVKGVGIEIDWQDGPLGRGEDRKEPNGAFVEGILEAALLEFYQESKFRCEENALAVAITHRKMVLSYLNERTNKREIRGVEGTHTA